MILCHCCDMTNRWIVFIKFHYNFKITNHFKRHRETDPEPEVDCWDSKWNYLGGHTAKWTKKKRKAIYDVGKRINYRQIYMLQS